MNWRRGLDLLFPYIEKLTPGETEAEEQRLLRDIAAIEAADWTRNDERALDEAQKVAATEYERVRTAEAKATTYLAVLAALVPVIITLQAANWEKKAGPAPDAVRLFVLAVATIYIAAAGYHAFKTLQVAGFQRVGEAEIAAAWETQTPLRKLTRGTLLATRRSRTAVNAKITRIRVTHEHLLHAFGTFVLLLLLDPFFYAMGYRNATQERAPVTSPGVERARPAAPQSKERTTPDRERPPVWRPAIARDRDLPPAAIPPRSDRQGGQGVASQPDCPEGVRDCSRLR